MYKYLYNTKSDSTLDEKTRQSIANALKKKRIYSDIIEFASEKELASVLGDLKKQTTNTLVVIGNDKDFNILVGQIGKLETDIAIGYLPLSKTRFSKKLKINSIQDAIDALSQRKINEITLYSLSSRYFYDSIELEFDKDSAKNKITVRNDKNLELQLPICSLKIENLNEDNYFSSNPIQLTAYHRPSEDSNLIKQSVVQKFVKLVNKNNVSESGELLLSLHSKNFKIESDVQATDSLGRKYKQSFSIGKASKNIRLISKRPDVQK